MSALTLHILSEWHQSTVTAWVWLEQTSTTRLDMLLLSILKRICAQDCASSWSALQMMTIANLHSATRNMGITSAQRTTVYGKKFNQFSTNNGLICRSFDSSYIHGTMLPCEETRKNLRVGSAHRLRGGNEPTMTSTGVHMVVTRADGNRANLNAEVRRTYNLRSKYFAST